MNWESTAMFGFYILKMYWTYKHIFQTKPCLREGEKDLNAAQFLIDCLIPEIYSVKFSVVVPLWKCTLHMFEVLGV